MRAIEALVEEHRVIRRGLAVLEAIAERVGRGEEVARDRVAALLDFFQIFADRCHHAKEEGALFPQLDEGGIPCLGGPVGVMVCEHIRGRALRRKMIEALTEWASGEARKRFVRAAREYIDLFRAHIDKEDQVLFRMAEGMLSPDEDRKLTEAYERYERDVVGEGVHERYHALVDDLERAFLGG